MLNIHKSVTHLKPFTMPLEYKVQCTLYNVQSAPLLPRSSPSSRRRATPDQLRAAPAGTQHEICLECRRTAVKHMPADMGVAVYGHIDGAGGKGRLHRLLTTLYTTSHIHSCHWWWSFTNVRHFRHAAYFRRQCSRLSLSRHSKLERQRTRAWQIWSTMKIFGKSTVMMLDMHNFGPMYYDRCRCGLPYGHEDCLWRRRCSKRRVWNIPS